MKNPYVLHYAGTNRKPWSPKASLISTRSMLSTLPYVLFRQKTPVRQPLPQALQLICMQAVSAFLRVTITHRIYNFRKMLEKRS